MNIHELSKNVKQLRNAKRLSQQDLAEIAGISLPAIKNLENKKSEPRVATLQAIAKALGVKLHELFQPARELTTVRFRSAKRMQNRENILSYIARRIDDFNYLEKTLSKKKQFSLNSIRNEYSQISPVEAAQLCRKKLGLKDTEPIHDICGLLEDAGVKVFPIPLSSDSFFGLSIGEDDGGPAVVVNVWDRISVERWIFSAAHEVGHLILHPDAYDVNLVKDDEKEEKEANMFASHFLMPDKGFLKEWKEALGLHFVDRVLKIKRIFRVSYKAILSRLIEHGKADNSIWKKFNFAFQKRYNRKLPFKEEPESISGAEPFGMQRFDFYEDRFSRLVREAVENDKISLSRGAEMLEVSIEEMQEILKD
ncbi:helix-turn-helix domain-containing protein [Flexistipes sp.]|uniref:helix-turn-helix domain-containing protein n=1 Tax=Flexistipes sp. TaxID=3088135 RepID=UPI002E220D2C|nr:XRE family transcriptional regulator [Flexistipes sp.]